MREIKLNAKQREAVEQIDGPMLVLAGPGTGKTQLLSARVARILEKTDTLPNNILCLTFTEAGAANMLERLSSFIGQAAYEVNISTYHAFGGELIGRHPEYFTGMRLETALDELGQHEIIATALEKLSYQNPLKFTNVRDIIGTIGEAKQALLTPEDLLKIANNNLDFLREVNPKISEIFAGLTRMPGRLDAARGYFETTLALLDSLEVGDKNSLARATKDSLELALEEAESVGKTKPLTEWKNTWLNKDAKDQFILKGEVEAKKLAALADIYKKYQAALKDGGLYDYNDMILLAVRALETSDEFRFSLQEKYQYILLDEYQDTSTAQARLVELLTNNPASEGQPNVMAVGDDDQAIYAFQGAEASNLANFATRYRDTKIISLNENYRSQTDILTTASHVANQIANRASNSFDGITKELIFSGQIKIPAIETREFLSEVAERDFVARQIEKLITENGVRPSEIAVLAPRHKVLEPLVPFLNNLQIPVRYEKRENILEAPIIRQLITMTRLVLALSNHDEQLANSYFPEVLSYEFWQIPLTDVWQLSWADGTSWTQKLLASRHRWLALFFMQLAVSAEVEPLEQMLDYLSGAAKLKINDATTTTATSPLKNYYTRAELEIDQPDIFYETISHLTVLRRKLRERQASEDESLRLADLIKLVDLYEASGTRMVNTSPYNQASESVQLMTVYKAKGLEFEHVFLLDCVDEIWGDKARGNSNRLTLPANLASIRRAGSTSDEQLRVFFVALTRAKSGLYFMCAANNYSGKATTRLKYLDQRSQADGSFLALALPEKYQRVLADSSEVPALISLEMNWTSYHDGALGKAELKNLLAERLKSYQLSPTHLNTFIDMERGGPREFLLNTLLRFPQAPTSSGLYGSAIHETLEHYQLELNQNNRPSLENVLNYFERHLLAKKLERGEFERRAAQGKIELTKYLEQDKFRPGDKAETKFKNEAVFLDEVHLNGQIDKMEIDPASKTMVVVDYKTGKPSGRWSSELKFHKYKQQLYIYKMLVEGSTSWRGWQVAGERLDFLRPGDDGELNSLNLNFNQKEFDQIKDLIKAVWRHIMALNFPDVSQYPKTLVGTRQFEADLIAGKI